MAKKNLLTITVRGMYAERTRPDAGQTRPGRGPDGELTPLEKG